MPVSATQFKKIALSFPDTSEATSYGHPSIKVGKKFFVRLRPEDNSITWGVDTIDERDQYIASDPETFHITDHYRDYPIVLVRLARIDTTTLTRMLERRWRAIALKKHIKAYDEARS